MTIVVYHSNCRDGFAAAWAIRTVYPDAKFIPGNYGKPLEGFPFAGEDVIFADFSLPRADMLDIAERAATLRVFDHHKSFTDPGAKQFIEQYKATMAFAALEPGGNMSSSGQGDHEEESPMEINTPLANAGKTPPPPGMRDVPIPIAGSVWPSIRAPFPMTEAAWAQMITVLNAMKPGLVASAFAPGVPGEGTESPRDPNLPPYPTPR